MPSRNIIKEYASDSYYHVYNRGLNKSKIFRTDYDYAVFLNLFKRHLSKKPIHDKKGRVYTHLRKDIKLTAFCLMPNHFHLLMYQEDEPQALVTIMRCVLTSYSKYFNKRYKRVGPLFQARYKAVRITSESYLWHISRYIHLNPLDIARDYKAYPYSSYLNFTGERDSEWLSPDIILEMHRDANNNYKKFVDDYISYREDIRESKFELANS